MSFEFQSAILYFSAQSEPLSPKVKKLGEAWVSEDRPFFIVRPLNTKGVGDSEWLMGSVTVKTGSECPLLDASFTCDLQRRNIRRIILLGSNFDGAVETNARVAKALGYDSYILVDQKLNGATRMKADVDRISRYASLVCLESLLSDILGANSATQVKISNWIEQNFD